MISSSNVIVAGGVIFFRCGGMECGFVNVFVELPEHWYC